MRQLTRGGRRARALVAVSTAMVGGLLVTACVPVGPSGGTRSFADVRTTVHIPPGAVEGPVFITAGRVADPLDGVDLVPGTGVDLAPTDGWLQPLEVVLGYDEGSVPAGVPETDLRILHHTDAGGWTVLPGSTVDADANTVIVATATLGRFAVGAAPVAGVSVVPGAIVVGYLGATGAHPWAEVDATVDVRDAEGRELGRAVDWTVPPDGIASVDADGVVGGLAPGTTTATAMAGGVSTTVPVCVGGAVDWFWLSPGSGPQLPPTLYLEVSATASCGQTDAPFRYFWACLGTNQLLCREFLAVAGGLAGGTLTSYEFPLAPGEIFEIGVQVCLHSCTGVMTHAFDGAWN